MPFTVGYCIAGKFVCIKGPLTCKIFIAEKGSVLLVEKLCGTLSCKQWLHGGENRGLSCQNLSFCN